MKSILLPLQNYLFSKRTRTIILIVLSVCAVLSALFAARTPLAQHKTPPSPAGFIATCATPPAGMVSWWPAESNGHDIVSHFNLSLGGAGFAIGEVGNAFSFNGTNFATPGNVAGLNFAGTAHVTIDGWINPSAAGGQGILFGKAVSGQGQYWLYMNGGEVEGALYLNSGGVGISSLTSPPANTWTHVALTYDGEDTNTLAIYINGALANSIPLSGNLAECNQGPCTPSQRQFTIGGRDDGFDFTGLIDEVEVFNTALSATDISNIYLAGSFGKCRTCTAPPANMIGWWPGDGNTKDIQGGNNGLLKNGATFATGEVGQAFSLAGDDYVDMGTPADLNIAGNQVTLDGWINPSVAMSSEAWFFGKVGDGATQYALQWEAGQLVARINAVGFSAAFTPPANSWTHLALVYNGAANPSLVVYVNGDVLFTSNTPTGSLNSYPSSPFRIGAFSDGVRNFTGLVDEVEVFNRALTADEIQFIYDAGSLGKCKPTCVDPPPGLIDWWPGDNTATDIQGGHNGTLQNGATFAAGKVDRAFTFNGSNQYVDIGFVGFPITFSIDAWIYPTNLGSTPVIISSDDDSEGIDFFVNADGSLAAEVKTAGLAQFSSYLTAPGTITTGTWQHVVVTYDGGPDAGGARFKFYVNGINVPANVGGDDGGVPGSSTATTKIGRFAGYEADDYYGRIDEVEIFNRVLTSDEAATLYNAGSAGKCKTARIYVADNDNITIEKFDINGVDLGAFADVSSGFAIPQGIAFDASGNLFVGDVSLSQIFKFDPLGHPTTFADSSAGLSVPYGLAFDASGILFVANPGLNSVLKFQPNGSVTTFASGAALNSPADVAFDRDGNVYVVNDGNGTVEKFTSGGADQGVFASATLQSPLGARFDSSGQLYVADFAHSKIEKFDSSGNDLGAFADVGSNGFYGIEFDPFGNLYGAQAAGNIYKFDPSGSATLFTSSPHVNRPTFIAVQLLSPTAACIQFDKPSYSVNETAGTVTLTVTRNGDVNGSSAVHYATADGAGASPAISPDDYTSTSGDLNFGPNETSMTFQVPIIVDDDSDPGSEPSSKTFTATLSNVTGAMLSGPATTAVTINDVHYTISVAVSGTNQGGGTTSGEGGTVSGAGTYDSGATVDLIATPNDCFTFTNWTEGNTIVSTDPHLTFTASTGRNLVANFTIKPGCAGACNSFATATIANVSSEYPGREAVHVVDGSGLDSNDPPNHDTDPTHMWMTGGDGNVGSSGADPDYPAQLGHITFNLNGTFSVSSFRVWNYNENTNFAYSNRGVNTLKISTSIDGVNFTPQINPATNTAIWTFDAAPTDPSYTGQVITFPTPLTAAYIRFDILTNHGVDPQDSVDHRFVGLSEIRFNMCPISCVPPPANLIAWWKGDGNANDSVGGHNGSLMSGATFGAGEVGQGFSFNGAGAFVSVPGPVANFGTGDFTVDFWMQTSSTDVREVINKRVCGTATDAFDVRLNQNGNIQVELLRNNDPSGSVVFGTRAYNDGQFHHISIVRSGNTLSIYGDGTLDNFVTGPNVSATNIDNNLPLDIAGGGCATPGTGDGTGTFAGVIDEVELFNRALNPDEIAGIVRAGGLGKCECTPPPGGMVSWWPGEGNGDDIQDGNNATINNILFAAGEVGQAFVFDGSTSDINVPASSNLDVGAGGGMTIDMWINPEAAAITAAVSPILAEWNAGSGGDEAIGTGLILDRDYGNNLSAGALEFEIVDTLGNGCALGTGPGAIVAGRWQHVAATYDKTSGQTVLYVNGQVVASGACGSLTLQTSYPLDFGIRRGGSGGARYTGAMDEMEVFNRALSAPEIAAIYHAGSAGKCRPCTPAPTGMVSWWPGDGNANDIQDGNTGTLQNGAGFAPAEVGQGFSLDGTDYVEVADSSNLSITGPMTIDAWINTNDNTSEHAIVEKYDGGGTDGYFFRIDPTGRLVAGMANASTFSTVTGNTQVTTGTFHHVAAVFDGTNLMVYLDGNLDGGPATSVTPTDGTNPLEIGARGGGNPGNFFNGLIDEVEIFNVALDPSEIAAIYDAGSGGKCKPPVPVQRQLANISSRADVGTGDNVTIAGFIVQTDSSTSHVRSGPTKKVLIRGIGPSITGVGSSTLVNPVLDLFNSQGTKIDHNDNWMEEPDGTNNPTRTAAIQATGLAPTNPNEAALLETLNSDSTYTAILSGKSGGTGIGLVEVYDLEATTNTHTHNLSTRAFVSNGDNVLIGGLIVQGDATARIVVRAIGPSLAGQGISNPLPDPVLQLFDGNGNLIETNDDWGSSPEASDISTSGLAPTNSKESAILFAPAPGPYTAIVHDKNNSSGIGLVESYWLGP